MEKTFGIVWTIRMGYKHDKVMVIWATLSKSHIQACINAELFAKKSVLSGRTLYVTM